MSGLDEPTGFSPAPSGATDTSSGATNIVFPPYKRMILPALPALAAGGQAALMPISAATPPRSQASSAKNAADAAARTAVAEARLALAEARLEEADLAEDEEQDLAGTTYAMRHAFHADTGMAYLDSEDGRMVMAPDGQWVPAEALTASKDLELARLRLEAQAIEQSERERVLREEHAIQQEALGKVRRDWEAAQQLIAAQQLELLRTREAIDLEVQAKAAELQKQRELDEAQLQYLREGAEARLRVQE